MVCGSAALRGRYYKSRFKAGSFQFASVTAADRPTAPDCATSARMSRLRRIAVSDRYFFVTCKEACFARLSSETCAVRSIFKG